MSEEREFKIDLELAGEIAVYRHIPRSVYA